ncbi:MAG TPA: ParA family protein [Candidatus Binataceae bacterium]|jgi:chromosome partitioning protein
MFHVKHFLVEAVVGRLIVVANQKGGVGKTTTAVNLAIALGLRALANKAERSNPARTLDSLNPVTPSSVENEATQGEAGTATTAGGAGASAEANRKAGGGVDAHAKAAAGGRDAVGGAGAAIASEPRLDGQVRDEQKNVDAGTRAEHRRNDVLLVDLDPQGNASSGIIADTRLAELKSSGKTIYEALVGRIALSEAIRPARERVFLAPSGPDLVGAEIELAMREGRERVLQQILAPIRDDYEYIIVDTPPSLGLLTLNALVAADSVIVPMQCEYYALEGLSALLETIKRIRSSLNPALKIDGLVLTMFDARNRLSHEIAREVEKHFPEKVFQNVIPRNVRLSESPSHGLSVIEYDPKSAGAIAYQNLAVELVARLNGGSAAAAKPEENDEAPARRSWSLRALFARDNERGKR